jgi:tyrosyl-tRNA synthetase
LIKSKGAYVVLPKSGTTEQPFHLKWEQIPEGADPKAFLVDFEALVLRSGKSNIRICRVIPTEQFEAKKLSVPGWEELKSKLADASNDITTDVVT